VLHSILATFLQVKHNCLLRRLLLCTSIGLRVKKFCLQYFCICKFCYEHVSMSASLDVCYILQFKHDICSLLWLLLCVGVKRKKKKIWSCTKSMRMSFLLPRCLSCLRALDNFYLKKLCFKVHVPQKHLSKSLWILAKICLQFCLQKS